MTILFLLILSPLPLFAGSGGESSAFRFRFRQELVWNRTTGRQTGSYFSAEGVTGGWSLEGGFGAENRSGRLSGYFFRVASPPFLRWFGAEALLVDRVYPEYRRGYLSYLFLLRYGARFPGSREEKPYLRLAGGIGPQWHFQRSAENHLYNPLPLGTEYRNLFWVYDLALILRVPLRGAVSALDMSLGVRNFTTREVGFVADYTTWFRVDCDAGHLSVFLELGHSPAGNFFLSGTWHTLILALGVTACF